jgi:cytochrome c553
MAARQSADWLQRAADEFDRHENRKDGVQVAGSLAGGLAFLRDSLFLRIHQDVERMLGMDSMLVPVSEIKAHWATTELIEAYEIAESTSAVIQFHYAGQEDDWYLRWLVRLRPDPLALDSDAVDRCRGYLSKTPDQRRGRFMDVLARTLPESRRAPLVLFRLFPLAIQIATALAFGDRRAAADLRRQQSSILPAITACRHCHGALLDCAEPCDACGNPLWKYEWLTTVE